MRFNNFWCYRHMLFSKGFAASLWQARKNLAASEQGRPPVAGPYLAELDITYRCNCRCQMCQRWKDLRQDELTLAEYSALAGQFSDLGVHQISIAGGEPLMRQDVFAIIEHFTKRGMYVNICTNGMLLEKYHNEICTSGAGCITVSLDGATDECHDNIRGFSGSCRQIQRGIEAFLANRRSTLPLLRVRMTISKHNVHEIGAFFQKWSQIADDVLFQPVHKCCDAYYSGMEDGSLYLDPAVVSEQIRHTPLGKDGYMTQLVQSLKETESFPHVQCHAGILMVRIDPWGNVYACLEQHACVGSVREYDFAAIWNSENFNRERKRIATNRPCSCWYNNTALIGHFGTHLKNTTTQYLLQKVKNRRESILRLKIHPK